MASELIHDVPLALARCPCSLLLLVVSLASLSLVICKPDPTAGTVLWVLEMLGGKTRQFGRMSECGDGG